MMGTLSPISVPVSLRAFSKFSNTKNPSLWNGKNKEVHCQGGINVNPTKTATKLSSAMTERPALMRADHHAAVMEAESLVLSPNGSENAKDLVPRGGPNTNTSSLVGAVHENGIGILKFLKGKAFFITGATGFLGKVLIEKILRTAPDVGKIYLLIKAKDKEGAMGRLHNIINSELFNCLQQIHGKSFQAFMLSKLVPVLGNICDSNLGLDEDTADLVAKNVDVIVNSAANTTFDERYDIALGINTGGPSRLMSFAKKCKKLKLFLQVSTAYVNGQRRGKILEKPLCVGDSIARESLTFGIGGPHIPQLNVEDEIKLIWESKQGCGENAVAQKMKELGLERAKNYGWQDTYVFTKAMGEMMIDKMRGEIPVVIMRPSVIESTYNEPFPGWIEGNRMMDPIILYYGKGQLSGFLVDPNGILDVVPADVVVNATLAAMARHGSNAHAADGNNVYQVASSAVNPLVFGDLTRMLYQHFSSSPLVDSEGRPIRVPAMKLYDSMDDFSSHLWRDAVRRNEGTGNMASRKKMESMSRKSVEQAKYLAKIYEPYTFYGGRFDNSNTEGLMKLMSEEEKGEFGFDVRCIDWKDYISNVHIPGLRRHVMKGRGISA